MKLGGFGFVAGSNNSGFGSKGFGDSVTTRGYCEFNAGMPVGSMASPTISPASNFLSRQRGNLHSASGLSLALAHGMESHHDSLRISELDTVKTKDDDYESRSGSDNIDGGSGDDQDPEAGRPNKKRYHRHAPAVIQELEAFFKECPHPDEKQRQELSRRLNLATRQVKFWFQNRRTQLKAQQERHENNILRQENERLRAENFTIREAMRNASCPTCGGPTAIEMSLEEQQIRFENARMREELERLYSLGGRMYGGKLLPSVIQTAPYCPPLSSTETTGLSSHGVFSMPNTCRDVVVGSAFSQRPDVLTTLEKNMITELAVVAVEEFMKMVYASEPLWIISSETGKETLDFNEYLHQFPRGVGPKPVGFRSEASREVSVVLLDAQVIVESFLDLNRWMELFPSIVSKAEVLEVIAVGSPLERNGALQMMTAELIVPSPLVPTRPVYFLRFCKTFGDGIWAVVDVSVDNLRGESPSIANKYRRRPSGCLIQQLPNGFSKVSWVEHGEFDESGYHQLFKSLVTSGMAFGAHRWISTLKRQAERLSIILANSLSNRAIGGLPSEETSKMGLLKLAQRMTSQLCKSLSASSIWTTLSGNNGEDEVRVMTRESSSVTPYEPTGMILSATTSIWLPVSPQRVFEFLTNPATRREWDALSVNGLDELVRVSKGEDPGNFVSLIRPIKSGENMFVFQECCSDASTWSLVYAPVDIAYMDAMMSGADTAFAAVPSGFIVMPDGPSPPQRQPGVARSGGSLVTVAFQLLVNSLPKSKVTLESINTMNNLVCNTVRNIKASLIPQNSPNSSNPQEKPCL